MYIICMTPAKFIFQILVFLVLSMSFFLFCININNIIIITIAKKVTDRPLEILRRGGSTKKNISARDNLMEKIHACNLTLTNIRAIA